MGQNWQPTGKPLLLCLQIWLRFLAADVQLAAENAIISRWGLWIARLSVSRFLK
jgi:hypothetical protein